MSDGHDIRQLLPSHGWYARYLDDDGKEFQNPLIGWALLKNGRVVGLDVDGADGDFREVVQVDAAYNFVGYTYRDPLAVSVGFGRWAA